MWWYRTAVRRFVAKLVESCWKPKILWGEGRGNITVLGFLFSHYGRLEGIILFFFSIHKVFIKFHCYGRGSRRVMSVLVSFLLSWACAIGSWWVWLESASSTSKPQPDCMAHHPLILIQLVKPLSSAVAPQCWRGLMNISDSYHLGRKSLTLSLPPGSCNE